MLVSKRQGSDEETPSASQAKRARTAKDTLASAGQGLESLSQVLERGLNALIPPTPSTPSRTSRNTPSSSSALESSPVRAQNAITQASTLEFDHLKDPELVMKFICVLEENSKAVLTYNTLVKTGRADLREAYVKQCIRKYDAAEERKDLGL